MPKVSICIPTYNRAHYLEYAVNSVLKQTYQDFELIICDDASSDSTPTMISQWSDPRIRYIRQPENLGRSKNMRSGFAAAQGEYFLKFDDDDALTPDFLAKTVTILDNYPQVDFVCTNHWIINAQSEKLEEVSKQNSTRWKKDRLAEGIIPDLLWQTFEYQSLQVGSTLFRQDSLASIDYMRPEADGCEDFDLLVRLAIAQKQGYFLPEFLMEYRFHGGQTSLRQNLHFLKAKLFSVESYRFTLKDLEERRITKVAQIQEDLGLRLIENGETDQGKKLLQKSMEVLGKSPRSVLGLFLAYFPLSWRSIVLEQFRRLKSKDYTEQVRQGN